MLLSMNTLVTSIRCVTREHEIGGKFAAELAQTIEEFARSGFFLYLKRAWPSDLDFNIVAIAQLKGIDNRDRQPNGQAIAPSGYLHRADSK